MDRVTGLGLACDKKLRCGLETNVLQISVLVELQSSKVQEISVTSGVATKLMWATVLEIPRFHGEELRDTLTRPVLGR